MKLDIEFTNGATPDTPPGSEKYFLVACRSRHDGKVRVFGAYRLNGALLHYEDGCASCPEDADQCPMSHGDGCPTTGWFKEIYDADYDRSWERLRGDVIAYAPQPKWPD